MVADQKARVLFEGDREVDQRKNSLQDVFGPYGVHVYSLRP